MEKKLLGIFIVILMLVAFVSGCTEDNNSKTDNDNNNEGSSEPKTVTMNAQEYFADMDVQMTTTTMKMDFKSLQDGDTLILQDTISNIAYDETTNITTIEFEYEGESDGESGTVTSSIPLIFEGNITSSYQVGDQVKVTLTIKHITVTIGGMSLDMEIYKEYWQSEEYFTSNYMTGNPYIPISASKIAKV